MVIAVLAIIASIAIPTLLGRRDESTFRTSMERVRGAMTMARAKAMESGEALAVSAVTDDRGVVRFVIPAPDRDEDAEPDDAPPTEGADADDPLAAIMSTTEARRILLDLPTPLRIVDESFMQSTIESLTLGSDPMFDASDVGVDDPFEEDSIVVAVFMPDGGAIPGPGAYLYGDERRVARIDVSRWTGRVTLERVSTGAADRDMGSDDDADTFDDAVLDGDGDIDG